MEPALVAAPHYATVAAPLALLHNPRDNSSAEHSMSTPNPAKSGTFEIGGDLPVHRLGFGAMRIVGKGVWGEPEDHGAALRTLKRVPELGITLIDTADSYGPEISERLIREALHPYKGLVIATKA